MRTGDCWWSPRVAVWFVVLSAMPAAAQEPVVRPNILMITADDLGRESVGSYGCTAPDITPHIDRLASEGMRFERAHVTVAVCQSSRSVWMTGRYPHRNGAQGFEPIRGDVPTLTETLREAGYLNGILGKVQHLEPQAKFAWDCVVDGPTELGRGRSAERYYEATRRFIRQASTAGRPFFLMANSHDPHRPFPGSAAAARLGEVSDAPRTYGPDEITVPGFLPDLPEVRVEVAQYLAAVRRLDATVGAVLRALADEGESESTCVLFMSDHGMSFPFAKMNCYLQSTRIPFVVRWPGHVAPGSVDRAHYVSGIDLMPTLLEIAGAAQVDGVDGRSFTPLLAGQAQGGRDWLVTMTHATKAGNLYPSRCFHDGRFGYLFNAWSDGEHEMKTEARSGLTFAAMRAAARSDEAVAARVQLFLYRVPDELYDFAADPDGLVNLAQEPAHSERLDALRARLLEFMVSVDDPLLQRFREHLDG